MFGYNFEHKKRLTFHTETKIISYKIILEIKIWFAFTWEEQKKKIYQMSSLIKEIKYHL